MTSDLRALVGHGQRSAFTVNATFEVLGARERIFTAIALVLVPHLYTRWIG